MQNIRIQYILILMLCLLVNSVSAQDYLELNTVLASGESYIKQARNEIRLTSGFSFSPEEGKTFTAEIVDDIHVDAKLNTSKNYVYAITANVEFGSIINPDRMGEANEVVQYFDGLGRPLQQIALQAGLGYKDIVTFNQYNEVGLENKT